MKNKFYKFGITLISVLALFGCEKNSSSVASSNSASSTQTNDVVTTNAASSVTETSISSSSSKVLATYTVTFNYNYSGATSTTAKVKEGESVTRPTDPTRKDYTFNGWYSDAELENLYNFEAPVTSDLTLYASWIEGDVSDLIKITYYLNYDGSPNNGIYNTVYIEKVNKAVRPTSPTRTDYYFMDWYTDSACTTKYDFNTVLGVNYTSLDLYAYWNKLYVFEAEDVDFTDKAGYGYSANVDETAMIEKDEQNLNASNGYFVSYLYYNGAFLEWKINSNAAVSDVVLIARLSAEFFDIEVNPSTYNVTVNGTSLTGYDISLTGVQNTMNKLPFVDFVISTKVSLNKGDNSIKLITNNENSHTQTAGTYKAEAPMIDCIKLATNEKIAWSEGYPVAGNYK